MNILYLSHLSGASFAGPTYSVPNQIKAQSKIDNVFWYNAVNKNIVEWKELPCYHDLSEYPDESIYKLPEPFNQPDIIVVEQFYNMTSSRLRRELILGDIPYVIIPRGELTQQAQKRKAIKKTIANILFCYRFAHKASAIQYLTEQEHSDSGNKWNQRAIIIPNGISLPKTTKEQFCKNGINCISIGRIEPYQKGLDILIDACNMIKEELMKSNCTIKIIGPDREGKRNGLQELVFAKGLDSSISFGDGVYGEEKEKLLLESDVFIIPSRFEGHPMALIEALSYGLPCVATTGSNMRDEITACEAGWTCDCNPNSLSEALLRMIADYDKEIERMSKNARRLSVDYSWDKIAEKSHSLYQCFI